MTEQFIGHDPVVASVLDPATDRLWLFTNKYQAQIFHQEMLRYGHPGLIYQEHS